jgi:acyl-CoA synthetase (AMP-forming)/AMP-acid ligase II
MINLAECLDSHARNRPTHPAVVAGEATLTHAEFAAMVARVEALVAGIAPGTLVGVALEDTPIHLAALFALARRGIVIVPMDCRWTEAEKANLARHFEVATTLVTPGDALVSSGLPTLAVDDAMLAAIAPFARPPAAGDLPLLLSLSSGTTGRPKGPLVTHGQFFRRFLTHFVNLGFNGEDRFLSATPLYFGGGRTFCMSTLFAGGTVILHPPPYAIEELPAVAAYTQPTTLFLVPTLLRRLLALDAATLAPLRGLRLLLSSGAPLTGAERTRIRDRVCPNLAEYYASTEGGGVSLLLPHEQAAHGTTVGRPIYAVEVEIVDDDHRPLPTGQVGRLRYRGPGCATGYFNDPEASSDAFHDGWFYPGDLAERDEAGFISLRGRRKDMIIRGGVNIYPHEIETCLLAHPAVADAAVVGAPSEEFGEIVVAHVVAEADPAELRAWCAARLARYKVPSEIRLIAELPRNSSGKVLKNLLV